MNKEELINFINGIDFELATNFELTYHKKKPKNTAYMSEENRYDIERKTITFNKDFENYNYNEADLFLKAKMLPIVYEMPIE